MGRSQRHLLVQHNSTSNGEIIAEGEVAPASLKQAGSTPEGGLRTIEDLSVPVGAPGGPLSGSTLTGAIPEDLVPEPPPEAVPPTIASIAPTSAIMGTPDVTVQVVGTEFAADSLVTLDNVDQATTFVSATELTAVVPVLAAVSPASIVVVVRNSSGLLSNAVNFTIEPTPPPLADEATVTRKRRKAEEE